MSTSGDDTLSVTGTAAFMKATAITDATLPSVTRLISARESIITNNSTVTLPLPASLQDICNPLLQFELVMQFPYTPQPPHAGPAQLAQIAAIPGNQSVLDLYYGAYPLNKITNTALNGGDYAMDMHRMRGYADLFASISLVNANGQEIDQMNGEKLHWFNMLQLMTGDPQDIYNFDMLSGTGLMQNVALTQPTMALTRGINAKNRCNYASLSDDKSTLTVRKTVNLPLPLEIGSNLPMQLLGDCQLVLKTNPLNNIFTSRAERFHGMMNLLSEAGFAGADLNPATQTNPLPGCIANYTIFPVINGVLQGQNITLSPVDSAARSALCITFRSVLLNADLESLTGPITAVVDNPWQTSLNAFETGLDYPAASIFSNGCFLNFCLEQLDIPQLNPVEFNSSFPLQDGQQNIDSNTAIVKAISENIYGAIGLPSLRKSSVGIQVPAQNIATVHYRPASTAFSTPSVTEANVAASVTAAVTAADIAPELYGSKGLVEVVFAKTILVVLPIYNADYSSKFLASTSDQPPVQTFINVPYVVNSGSQPTGVAVNGYSLQPVWTPKAVNAMISVELMTNSFGTPGLNHSNHAEVNLPLSPTTDVPLQSPKVPRSIQPSSWSIENLALRVTQPMVPADIKAKMEAAYHSPTGFHINKVVAVPTHKQLVSKRGEEFTMTSPASQVYGMFFGIMTQVDNTEMGVDFYLPSWPFSQFRLNENNLTTLAQWTPRDLLGVVGGPYSYTFPSANDSRNPALSGTNACARYKGSGRNLEMLNAIQSVFANVVGTADAEEASALVNMEAVDLLRLQHGVWYSRTLGGAAEVSRDTKFTITFAPAYSIPSLQVYNTESQDMYASNYPKKWTFVPTGNGGLYSWPDTIAPVTNFHYDVDATVGANWSAQMVVVTFARRTYRITDIGASSTSGGVPYILQ